MRIVKYLIVILMILSTGCASYSYEIQPKNVSTSLFQNLNCDQLVQELDKNYTEQASFCKKVDDIAGSDRAITWFGVLIMPIVLVAIHGDKEESLHLSMLKGNSQALLQVASDKNCKDAINLSINKDSIIQQRILKVSNQEAKKVAEEKAFDEF